MKLTFRFNPWQCTLLLIGIIIQGLLSSITIWLSSRIVTEISRMTSYDAKIMLFLCGAWCLSLLVGNFIEPWILYWQSNISDNAVHSINKTIIEKSNSIKRLDFFEKEEFHNDIQVLQSQASNKPINLVITTVGLARDIVIIVSLLILLYAVVPWVSFLVLAGAFINYKTFSNLQEKTWQESLGRSKDSRKMNYLSATAINSKFAKEIRLFGLGSFLINEYTAGFKNIYGRMKKVRLKQTVWPLFPITLAACGNLVAFIFIVKSAITGHIAIGAVILFLQSLSQLHLTVTNFGEQAGWLKGHILFFNKYFDFMRLKEPTYHRKITTTLDITEKFSIEFRNVYFGYGRNADALQDINFKINTGEKIALMGENGAGKTTLIKLLCGFYTPSSGQILINNVPLETINLDWWRKQISPLFQDFNCYAFSLEKNITMGAYLNEEKFFNALSQAGVEKFSKFLKEGAHTLLGKDFGGEELSQGQWQKVALARALYKNSSIYIMDEPTSSMDMQSEQEIFSSFIAATEDKTVIYITHRVALGLMANKIILLDKGRIKELGTHKELLNNNGMYAEIFTKQVARYFP